MTGQTHSLLPRPKKCSAAKRSKSCGRNELAGFRASAPIIHTRNYFSAGSAKCSNRRFYQVKGGAVTEAVAAAGGPESGQ